MKYYDARETRDPAAREHDLLARLPAQIAHAKARAPAFAALLQDVGVRAYPNYPLQLAAFYEAPAQGRGSAVLR